MLENSGEIFRGISKRGIVFRATIILHRLLDKADGDILGHFQCLVGAQWWL